jgi:hypothetical protein
MVGRLRWEGTKSESRNGKARSSERTKTLPPVERCFVQVFEIQGYWPLVQRVANLEDFGVLLLFYLVSASSEALPLGFLAKTPRAEIVRRSSQALHLGNYRS